jgi:spore coat protein U-like protein
MPNMFKSVALAVLGAALFASSSVAPTGAATNQAVLTVNATVTNNCDVAGNPAMLSMSYDPLTNTPTLGTSSFTYACTNGASVSVTPASLNVVGAPNWEAVYNSSDLLYTLWNNSTCSGSGQLSNGVSESLSAGTGSSQTYNICAIPNTGQQTEPAGTYVDTVTFTFNFGP